LAEYERELIVERVNAKIAAARDSGTRFRRPQVNLEVIAEKLAIVADARNPEAPRPMPPVSSGGAARRSTSGRLQRRWGPCHIALQFQRHLSLRFTHIARSPRLVSTLKSLNNLSHPYILIIIG
jgi:hypothetical protein